MLCFELLVITMRSPDKSLVGLCGPTFDVWIERGKVRELARATYSRHPAYLTALDPVISPTYLSMAGYIWGYTLERPGDTVLALAGLTDSDLTLHAEDVFTFHGPPPRAGTKLLAQTKIADIVEKQGRRSGKLVFWKMLTEFRDEDGTLVAEDLTTSVETENAPSSQSADVTPTDERAPFSQDEGARLLKEIEPARWADLKEGDGPGPITFPPLTLTEIVRYQGAAVDDHPMHHDESFARQGGYPTNFSIGLLHVATLASYATYWLGPENVRRLQARFLGLHWPGDRLTYEGNVLSHSEISTGRQVEVGLTCHRQSGEQTLDVSMTFTVN